MSEPAATAQRDRPEISTDRSAAGPAARNLLAGLPAGSDLVQARLGIASSLFAALRCRSAHTADHSLRVALGCSSWAIALGLSSEQCDILEVAALLHDIGKIGAPDSILLKPGDLTKVEAATLEEHRRQGLEILRESCGDPAVLEIVRCAKAWFDGSKQGHSAAGPNLPLGARMLAIADAFDSMTSDQPYRRAMSREPALVELFRCAGTQFDPDLVRVFAELQRNDLPRLQEQVASRWLRTLQERRATPLWRINPATNDAGPSLRETFQQALLDNLADSTIFVDAGLRITLWNQAAERMTGIAAASIVERCFVPSLLDMRDDDGVTIHDDDCPVATAIATGERRLRRLVIRGRGRKDVEVDGHAAPVVGPDGAPWGAILILHDVSPERSLEARCQSLHEMATKDPLTQVANRAEFDRVHAMFVQAHLDRQLPCSMIMADIDHFKLVNDGFGHQAGDAVLRTVAKALKAFCRPGDLVARYGGEEFVVLCADCDNATAARRAEELRKRIGRIEHAPLNGKRVTVSFGVTEIQNGDTTETMLARADRALYEAKDRGRDTVVQLGSGLSDTADSGVRVIGDPARRNVILEQDLVSTVPLSVVIEKLRGFVADQRAEIIAIDRGVAQLRVGEGGGFLRRRSDRAPLLVQLAFEEGLPQQVVPNAKAAERKSPERNSPWTRIHVEISPQRSRDRRREAVVDRARQVLSSIRAYLMASDAPSSDSVLLGDSSVTGAKGA